MNSLGVRNRWGVVVPRSASWLVANGVSDGHEFFCRACCDLAIADQYMPDIEGDIVENWLSNMKDEGFIATVVVAGVECASCEKVVK